MSVAGTGEHCQPTASGVPGDCAIEEDDPRTGGDAPLESDFGPEAPELEPEDGADLEPERTAASARSYAAYRYTIKIRRRYAGEPGDGLSTTIRRYNNSFVIGNALDGWRFDLARRNYNSDFGYRTGRIYGGFGTCGWIRSGPVSAPPDGDTTTGCSPYFRPRRARFADGLNCQPRKREGPNGEPARPDCNRATLIELERNVTDVDFCLNVDPPPVDGVPRTCENKASTRLTPAKISAGYKVSWRYVTNGPPGKRGTSCLSRTVATWRIHAEDDGDSSPGARSGAASAQGRRPSSTTAVPQSSNDVPACRQLYAFLRLATLGQVIVFACACGAPSQTITARQIATTATPTTTQELESIRAGGYRLLRLPIVDFERAGAGADRGYAIFVTARFNRALPSKGSAANFSILSSGLDRTPRYLWTEWSTLLRRNFGKRRSSRRAARAEDRTARPAHDRHRRRRS